MCEFCYNLFILFLWEGFETKIQNPNTIKENMEKYDTKIIVINTFKRQLQTECKYLYTILQLEG